MNVSRNFFNRAAGAAILIGITGAAGRAPAQPKTEPAGEVFRLRSPSFEAGAEMPTLYTCDGSNTSPPLVWSDPPHPAKAFVITMTDLDATAGRNAKRPFVHWILYNVAGEARALGESLGRNRLPGPAREGTNDFKLEGYDGPCPPPRGGVHHYVFTLYALDGPLTVAFYPQWPEVESAMAGHAVATTTLEVTYERGERR